jgi:hypothetical protein
MVNNAGSDSLARIPLEDRLRKPDFMANSTSRFFYGTFTRSDEMKRLLTAYALLMCCALALAQKPKAKEEYEGCDGIQDKDRKSYCIAVDKGDSALCKKIGNNDRRQLCLAKLENSEKHCERITDAKTKKRCQQSIR